MHDQGVEKADTLLLISVASREGRSTWISVKNSSHVDSCWRHEFAFFFSFFVRPLKSGITSLYCLLLRIPTVSLDFAFYVATCRSSRWFLIPVEPVAFVSSPNLSVKRFLWNPGTPLHSFFLSPFLSSFLSAQTEVWTRGKGRKVALKKPPLKRGNFLSLRVRDAH